MQQKFRKWWIWPLVMLAILVIGDHFGKQLNNSKFENPLPDRCDEATCTDVRALGWIERGKDTAKQRLPHTEALEFRKVYLYKGRDAIPTICGEVRQTNATGTAGDFQSFLTTGQADKTYFSNDTKEFPALWKRLCEG